MDEWLQAEWAVSGVLEKISRWMRKAVDRVAARARHRVQMGFRTIAKSGRKRIHVPGRGGRPRDKFLIIDRTQPSTTMEGDSVTTFHPEHYTGHNGTAFANPMRRM